MIGLMLDDPGSPATCHPLTVTRTLAQCPVGNQPLGDVLLERAVDAGFVACAGAELEGGPRLHLSGDVWLSTALLAHLAGAGGEVCVCSPAGELLGWIGAGDAAPAARPCIEADGDTFRIVYPWDLLRINEILVGGLTATDIRGEVSPRAEIRGNVIVGERTQILPGVFIEGNAMIGADCKIGPNCYIRGNTSIGDGCHVGQAVEIKNAVLMDGVGMGHLSYCGDSIVGEGTNFGAGTITANFRHDGNSHWSRVGGVRIDTGRRKLGAIIGDDVHTGIHTSIYPGRKLWPHTTTLPGQVVDGDLTGT